MLQTGQVSLEIVSKRTGRPFRQHQVDGIATIGVESGEPFALRLRSQIGERIGVRFSVDGTDVQSAKPATDDPHQGSYFLVNAYGATEIAAWVESQQGGAALVFAPSGFGVAQHTHGDISQVGYLGAVVFRGREPAPVLRAKSVDFGGSGYRSAGLESFGGEMKSCSLGGSPDLAVGAGAYTEQRLETVAGLISPSLWQTLTVRYLPAAQVLQRVQQHPSGFRQSAPPSADLSGVPRFGHEAVPPPNGVLYC